MNIFYSGDHAPVKGSHGAAAWDLRNGRNESISIRPGRQVLVGTGVSMEIPNGYVGLVCSRSGLAARGVVVANAPGVIDPDYRGEIRVLLRNLNTRKEVLIRADARIAQLLIVKSADVAFFPVSKLRKDTERGDGGFGSTGE